MKSYLTGQTEFLNQKFEYKGGLKLGKSDLKCTFGW